MFVPFESMSATSRVWIYQSGRKLSERDKTIISGHLKLFTEEWAAHGQPLKASFDIQYDQFIIVAADEGYNAASGCSIDASVRVMKEIEKELQLDLFNRDQVAFKKESEVALVAVRELKQKYREGIWNEKTLTFNNLIDVKGKLAEGWIIPAGTTWLKRYMGSETLAN
jgi:hypothetical protein